MRFLLKILSRPSSSPSSQRTGSQSFLLQDNVHADAFLRQFRLSLRREILDGAAIRSPFHGLTLSDLSHDSLQDRFDGVDLSSSSYIELKKHTDCGIVVRCVDDNILEAVSWSLQVFCSFLKLVNCRELVLAFFHYLMNFCVTQHHVLACIGTSPSPCALRCVPQQ